MGYKGVDCSNTFPCRVQFLPYILQSTIVMAWGRPEGSKSSQGHAVGGAKVGSGRKKKQSNNNQLSSLSICKSFQNSN